MEWGILDWSWDRKRLLENWWNLNEAFNLMNQCLKINSLAIRIKPGEG